MPFIRHQTTVNFFFNNCVNNSTTLFHVSCETSRPRVIKPVNADKGGRTCVYRGGVGEYNCWSFFRQLSFLACTNPYVVARAEVLTLLLSHAAPSSLVGCRGLNPPVKFHDERASLMSYRVSIDGWTASTLAHSFHPVALALSLQKAFFHFLGRMHVRERLFTYEWSQTTGWVRFSSIWGGECTDLVYWVDTKMFSCCQKNGIFFFLPNVPASWSFLQSLESGQRNV